MGLNTGKRVILKFLILQGFAALVLYIGLWHFRTDYSYTVVLFVELYSFSLLNDWLNRHEKSAIKPKDADENSIDTIARVISVEKMNMRTDFGEFYRIKLALDDSPNKLVVELEILDSKPRIKKNTTVPIRYMPDKDAAMILLDELWLES